MANREVHVARNIFRGIGVGVLFSLLIWSAEVQAETSARQTQNRPPVAADPYSLTISGGISLGVYEAGLNAVIVDSLRDRFIKSGRREFRLDTVTGASAGAINALISVIRFCEQDELGNDNNRYIYSNLFKDTWQNVDVKDLLSENQSDYDVLELDMGKERKRPLKDSIFSRKIFKDIINTLRQRVSDGQFREDMKVNLAFTVTRSKPLETSIMTSAGPQKINSQRFVIPLIATTKRYTKNGISRVGLFFKNNTSYMCSNGMDMEHLLLPESDGYVEFDQVARAALASSAFPFAFGRVELAYCEQANGAVSSGETLSGSCPKGYNTSSGFFIDGGTFDNVPLGLAVDLVEQPAGDKIKPAEIKPAEIKPATYIYMDPANRRSVAHQLNAPEVDNGSLVLAEQVKTWVPAFSTLMNGELYRTLIGQFKVDHGRNAHRALLLTRRFPPLTGNFLGHFGAFFDPSFRLYDYSAGVYDGLMNATDYLYCLKQDCRDAAANPDIVAAEKAKIFLELAKDNFDFVNTTSEDREMHQLIRAFLQWEKTAPAWNEAKEFFPETKEANASSYAVFEAITGANESDFKGFLTQLKPNKNLFKDQVKFIINNPDWWTVTLANRAINRLVDIEIAGDGGLLTPLKISSMAVNLKETRGNKATWSLSAVSKKKSWYRFVPDAIAMDGAQTGVAVSYLMAPKRFVRDWVYFEWEIASLHTQIKEIDDERINYYSFGGALRHSFESAALSSIGLGLYPNQNFGNTGKFGKDFLWGGELNFGFAADRIRLSIGTRDMINNYPGEDLTVRFGFTDIDAWLSLF